MKFTHEQLIAAGYVFDGTEYRRPHASPPGDCPGREQKPEGSSSENPEGAATELPCAEFQKLKDVDPQGSQGETVAPAAPDYEAGVSTVDGESRPAFRISVTLYVSRGRRDPVGALETICDLITITRRRLMERLPGGQLEGGPVPAKRRRRNDRDRTDFVKPPGPVPF